MNLTAAILQMALSIMTLVNTTPGLPQSQRDQALSIASQALLFAQTSVAQGYTGTNVNCVYQNCYYNSGTAYNYNTFNPNYGYPAYGATSLSILNASNVDTSFLTRGQVYTFTWSPFVSANGPATIQLVLNAGGTTWLGQSSSGTFAWLPNVASGTYQLQILQNGTLLTSRSITVQ